MLAKLALLFLCGMALLVMISARPRKGDAGWSSRFRLGRRRDPKDRDRRG